MQTKEERLRRREERKAKRREKIKKAKEEIKQEFKFNAPNILTLIRLILTFVIVYMIFSNYSRLSMAIVFVIAALTDYFDGITARKFNQKSFIGARLDQVIDRIFTVTVVIALIIYFATVNPDKKTVLMLFLVCSREIIAFPGNIIRVVRAKDLYEVRIIGKITNWVQGIALFFIIAGFNFAIYFAIVACIVGIISGFDYLKRSFM